MSRVRVYGLASCERCRRARQWLATRGTEVTFVDLTRTGLEAATLDRWLDALPWEALLNRRSASWRALPAERREGVDRARARTLMLEVPRLVKRPVLDTERAALVGFDPDAWERAL